MNIIDKEPAIKTRKRACKVFGGKVVAPLIKGKKFRKPLTTYIDALRMSTTFRDRQLYLTIARASYKSDPDIFKKHFAKAIGTDLVTEKVVVVQIMLAKICKEVEVGYSKSVDKVRQVLQLQGNRQINQFFESEIEAKTRYIEEGGDEEEKREPNTTTS